MAVAESQAAISAALRLVEIEGKGRGLVATEPLKGGQIVLCDSPILLFSAFPLRRQEDQEGGSSYPRYCAHCFRCLVAGGGASSRTTFTCPLCSHPDDAIFCSSKCQSLALISTHTPWVCQALSYLRNCPLLLDQPEECQVQVRYLVAAFNLAMVSTSAFQSLLSLHGDVEMYLETAVFLYSIVSLLPFPERFPTISVGIIASLLAKESCNSFSLMEPLTENGGISARAYGLYPKASFFNHDCIPNACRFDYLDSATDENTDIIIRMIHDVPQGQEICFSYACISLSYDERRKRLQELFGFACLCDRCNVEVQWSAKDGKNKAETKLEVLENNEITLRSTWEANEVEDSAHSSFLVRHVCAKDNCGGTLAPLPPSDDNSPSLMECNFCGSLINGNFMVYP